MALKYLDLNSILERTNDEFDSTGRIDLNILAKELVTNGFFCNVTDICLYLLSNIENEIEFPIEFLPVDEDEEFLTDEYIKMMS